MELSHFIISRFSNVCWALMTFANENACLNFHPSLHIFYFFTSSFYPRRICLMERARPPPMIRSGLMSAGGGRRTSEWDVMGRRERLEMHLHTLRVISAAVSGASLTPLTMHFKPFPPIRWPSALRSGLIKTLLAQ